jgi:hypothetical protein
MSRFPRGRVTAGRDAETHGRNGSPRRSCGGLRLDFCGAPFRIWAPPRFAESGRYPQPHSATPEHNSASKPEGSAASPFFIRIPKTAEEAAQEAEDRREKASTDWWLMIFTGAVAFFTLALVGATVALYRAGEAQRKHAEKVAERQAGEMKESIAEATRAADTAERTLIAGQRAWVKLRTTPIIAGPLTFDQHGAHSTINFELTNIGQSPATDVGIHAWLFVQKPEGAFVPNDLQRRCAEIRNRPRERGFTLLPNDNFPETVGLEGYGMGVSATAEDIAEGLLISTSREFVSLFVIGCVDYTFATDPDGHHQTSFIYEIMTTSLRIHPKRRSYLPTELRLMEFHLGGMRAD